MNRITILQRCSVFIARHTLILAVGWGGGVGGALCGCAADPDHAGNSGEVNAPGTVAYDRNVFHQLLENHTKITRHVREIEGGIESTTESDDPQIVALLKDHVVAMKSRIHSGRRIRQWDPLYVAVFDAADRIDLDVECIEKGVRVRETSSDPKVVALIREHAGVVSGFVNHGFDESAKAHPVPDAAK